MKYLVLALAFLSFAAQAQQPAPTQQDYSVAFYRQLLTEANDRLANATAALKIAEEHLAKRKAEDEKAAAEKAQSSAAPKGK